MSHPAILWEPLERADRRVRCNLCAHRCVVAPGKLGACCVRENVGGELRTLVYGRTIAQHVDPIEKKPLFHFLPASTAFSVATLGCNFRCAFCQNWEISQLPRDGGSDDAMGVPANPRDLALLAKRRGCASIAYTYTEPTIFAEYALDIAREARDLGLRNVFVSNGYMTPELIDMMSGLIDGINVDLKAGRGDFYHKISGGDLKPVLRNLRLLRDAGIWLEVTTLVIPGYNDSAEELRGMARHLHDEAGPDVPWHISRFYPQYEMDATPATPVSTLERAYHVGRDAGLHFVYVGNVFGHDSESTRCPGCGTVVIARSGYRVSSRRLVNGCCASCGTHIAGIGL